MARDSDPSRGSPAGGSRPLANYLVRATTANYLVRATTTNPNGKPFKWDGRVGDDDAESHAGIPKAKMKESAVLSAWARVYYELDLMYKYGSNIIGTAEMGTRKVTVENPNAFTVNDRVHLLDEDGRETVLRTIVDITDKVLTLNGDLGRTYRATRTGFVGKETGTLEADFFTIDTVIPLRGENRTRSSSLSTMRPRISSTTGWISRDIICSCLTTTRESSVSCTMTLKISSVGEHET